MSLKVSEYILDKERVLRGSLQSRETTSIVLLCEERAGSREEIIEDPIRGVIDRFQISHATVAIDLQIGDMTLTASNLLELLTTCDYTRCLLVRRGLEIIEQVELHEIYNAGWYFIRHAVTIRILECVRGRRRFDLILCPI